MTVCITYMHVYSNVDEAYYGNKHVLDVSTLCGCERIAVHSNIRYNMKINIVQQLNSL